MAMVTCPKCKKIVSDSSGKCPNCGADLKAGAKGKGAQSTTLGKVSSAILMVSAVLVFIELFDVAKTYVSGILLGIGFVLHGVNQAKMVNEEGYIGKRKIMIIYAIGAVIFVAGIVFLVFDLTHPV